MHAHTHTHTDVASICRCPILSGRTSQCLGLMQSAWTYNRRGNTCNGMLWYRNIQCMGVNLIVENISGEILPQDYTLQGLAPIFPGQVFPLYSDWTIKCDCQSKVMSHDFIILWCLSYTSVWEWCKEWASRYVFYTSMSILITLTNAGITELQLPSSYSHFYNSPKVCDV